MKNNNYDDQEFLPVNPGSDPEMDDFEFEEISMIEDFCFEFNQEQKIDFLTKLGYKIKTRKSSKRNQEGEFQVAVKPGERKLPSESNIDDLFEKEVKNSILNILLKYGRN